MKENTIPKAMEKKLALARVSLLESVSKEITLLQNGAEEDSSVFDKIKDIEATMKAYRQLELLRLLLSGVASKEIARIVGLSEGRVSQMIKEAKKEWLGIDRYHPPCWDTEEEEE